MVPVAGLEPARRKHQRILSPPCLPFHHTGKYPIILSLRRPIVNNTHTADMLPGIKCREVSKLNVNYFLGANSSAGFYSLYGGFCRGEGDFLHLIKAGPGCGKSCFMRRIADAAAGRGYDTECVLCSGDPDSLDAVYIPELRLGFMDATAPHACEAELFAHDSDYVNLGRFCGRICDPRVRLLSDSCRELYRTAYAYLAAAGSVERSDIPGLINAETLEKVRKRAQSAALRELGGIKKSCAVPREERRFISCISCKGELVLTEDIQKLCKQIYLLDDRCGLAGEYLEQLRCEALARGAELVLCPSPLRPERLEALLLPEQGLGFISSRVAAPAEVKRHVRLDALAEPAALCTGRGALRRRSKLRRELLDEALRWLRLAKERHDELESVYKPYVDFAALDEFTDETISEIFK